MADHRVHRGGERVRLAVDRHLHRVADEKHVDAGRIEELSGRRIDVERLKPGVFRDIDTIYKGFLA